MKLSRKTFEKNIQYPLLDLKPVFTFICDFLWVFDLHGWVKLLHPGLGDFCQWMHKNRFECGWLELKFLFDCRFFVELSPLHSQTKSRFLENNVFGRKQQFFNLFVQWKQFINYKVCIIIRNNNNLTLQIWKITQIVQVNWFLMNTKSILVLRCAKRFKEILRMRF